jgi:hypothetical protein
MSNYDEEIKEALRNYIKAEPFLSGWDHMTRAQIAKKAAAGRKLNVVLRKAGIERGDAFMKYGPRLWW